MYSIHTCVSKYIEAWDPGAACAAGAMSLAAAPNGNIATRDHTCWWHSNWH